MKSLKECRILVTPTSYGKYDPELKRSLEEQVKHVIYNESGKPLSSEQVANLLPGIDGYIAGLDFIDANALASADKLKVIARYGVGIDRVDLQAAVSKGIVVTNTPGANSRSVAELTIGFMLSLARMIPLANDAVRRGEWPRLQGMSLNGKTIGIVGYGSVGQLVVSMLKPFLCKILVYDPFIEKETVQSHNAIYASLSAIQKEADIISLHLPLLPETTNLVDKAFMRGMKKGSSIINTSRGGIINEDELYDVLKEGHLHGAALDVYSDEPPQVQKPIFSIPQVIFTPHSGANTDDAANTMGALALEDCLRVLKGETPHFRAA